MPHIGGCYAKSKLQSSCADKKIGEWKADALCRILAVDLAGSQSNRNRHRMHRNGENHLSQKLAASGLPLRRVGAGHSVCKLDRCNDGNSNIFTSATSGNLSRSLSGILPASF